MNRSPLNSILFGALIVAMISGMFGCAGYRFGNQTLYPLHIHTVYVPTCESSSFRPGLGERITEALVKEIEKKTPYKVVSSPEAADSILTCQLVDEGKRVVAENWYDDPRQVEYWFNVNVNWIDRTGQPICQGGSVPIPQQESANLLETSDMMAEVGQSGATAQQEVIKKIARRIVTMMESPW